MKSDPRGLPGPWALRASSTEQQFGFSLTGLVQTGTLSPLPTDPEAGTVTQEQSLVKALLCLPLQRFSPRTQTPRPAKVRSQERKLKSC